MNKLLSWLIRLFGGTEMYVLRSASGKWLGTFFSEEAAATAASSSSSLYYTKYTILANAHYHQSK